MSSTKRHPAWKMLLCSCLLIGGGQGILVNCAGLFITPVCAANGFGVGPFSTYLSLGAVAMMIGFPLAGKIMAKFPLKPLMLISILLTCSMYVLYSFFNQLWMFYVAVLFVGFGSVVPSFIVGPMLVTNWFEAKRGMAMGIAMACAGVFATIFSIVGGQLIATLGYQMSYRIMAAVAFLIMLPAPFLAVAHPAMMGLKAYGAATAPTGDAEEKADDIPGVPYKAAVKSLPFLCMFVCIFFVVCAGSFMPQISVLATSIGFDIAKAGTVVAVGMVGSLLGSLVLGFFNDKLGVRNTTILVLALGVGSVCLIVFGGSSLLLLNLGIALFGITASAGGIQPPMIVGSLFGQKEYTSIYGTLQIALSLAGIVATPVYGFVFDTTGSFSPGLLGIGALLGVAIVLTFIAYQTYKKLWNRQPSQVSSQ